MGLQDVTQRLLHYVISIVIVILILVYAYTYTYLSSCTSHQIPIWVCVKIGYSTLQNPWDDQRYSSFSHSFPSVFSWMFELRQVIQFFRHTLSHEPILDPAFLLAGQRIFGICKAPSPVAAGFSWRPWENDDGLIKFYHWPCGVKEYVWNRVLFCVSRWRLHLRSKNQLVSFTFGMQFSQMFFFVPK